MKNDKAVGRHGPEEPAKELVRLLAECGQTVATAESCTGGLIAQTITSVPGASAVFECGVVAYANRIKQAMLGVCSGTLREFGAVSELTAREMAEGVRKASGSSYGVSTTGIAGPGGGTAEKPVGTVHIAACSGACCLHEKLSLLEECGNNREAIRREAARRALQLLLCLVNSK